MYAHAICAVARSRGMIWGKGDLSRHERRTGAGCAVVRSPVRRGGGNRCGLHRRLADGLAVHIDEYLDVVTGRAGQVNPKEEPSGIVQSG